MLIDMNGEINSNTIIVGDFNIPLTPMDRSVKQNISKETQNLNDTVDQLDLIDIYRTFHPKTMNFTFFSSAHGTFFRIDHILGHKSSLGKFKKIEITPSIFSDHNAVRYLQPYLSLLRLMAGSHLRTRQIGSERNNSRSQLQEKNY